MYLIHAVQDKYKIPTSVFNSLYALIPGAPTPSPFSPFSDPLLLQLLQETFSN